MFWFILALIINLVFVILFLLYGFLRQKDKFRKYVLLAIVMLLTPIGGMLVLSLGTLIYHFLFKTDLDLAAISFNKERVNILLPPDVETEINIVPVEEALEVADKNTLRRVLLNVLKGDAKRSMSSVALALESEDSETSHYAASFIVDAINDFKQTVENMMKQLDQMPEDKELNLLIIDYLNQVLSQNFLNEIDRETYIYTMETAVENLFERHLDFMTGLHYLWISHLFMDIENFPQAQVWVQRGLEHRGQDLEVYEAALKYYYMTSNKEQFFDCLETLKASSIPINHSMLQLIRLFS